MNNLEILIGVVFFVTLTIGTYEATKYYISNSMRSNVATSNLADYEICRGSG